jgi:hypothetical protein
MGEIVALREAYAEFTRAVISGKRENADEAQDAFKRQVIVNSGLISPDKQKRIGALADDYKLFFHRGSSSPYPGSTPGL